MGSKALPAGSQRSDNLKLMTRSQALAQEPPITSKRAEKMNG
jgi:hypothetical protein